MAVTVRPSEYWKECLQGLKSGPAEVLVIFFKSTLQKKKTSCSTASVSSNSGGGGVE